MYHFDFILNSIIIKVFNSCATLDGNIDRDGLQLFCQKLQLGDNSSYIIGQLLPHKESRLNFGKFKEKFITLLPEIIEISDEDIEESPRQKSRPFESTEDLLSAGEDYSPQSSSNPEYSNSRPQVNLRKKVECLLVTCV